ncbi:bZIP_1 domain-containing protein/DOG1 domain-containing protein [Cephalotus follicularis]|uniref:BZIP_1 domain-containing protein/DOG1 domain-containing protein n=1 Tax=Cephalotus follicularis TaxID=3775 RepID=A0A1Q3ATU3_CEPFO|nr:bZIP_1 domain-containing protein/DOG1 domain-containing protein [Cephalotus follicularis]
MQSFKPPLSHTDLYCHSSFFLRGDDNTRNQTRFVDLGELDQPTVAATFHHDDAVDLSPTSMSRLKSGNVTVASNSLHYGALNTSIGSTEIISIGGGGGGGCLDTGQYMYQKGSGMVVSSGNGHIENWGDSGMADNSQQTDTSTDIDTDDKNQIHGVQHGAIIVADSMDKSNAKAGDQKTLRRLAQNREAARKSRLRKKAYVQQLETSRLRLAQLEQELQRARQQGMFIASGLPGDRGHFHSMAGNGALAFDMDYARWLEEHQRLINDLRSAVNSQMGDNDLRLLVDDVMAHYGEIYRLKSIGAQADVFHMLSGMWKTPAERCFMWLGGFRSSELLKILGNHLEPLTEQQLMGICNLQQSSQQAEDALSQGMEALQQSLVETLSSASLGPAGSGNVSDYMGQMAIAMGKIATLENFLHQADLLRQQTLQQMHRILTTRQAARALLVINDFTSRLRALSSLWFARPRD